MKSDETIRKYLNRLESNPRLKGKSWEYYKNELDGKAPTTKRNYLVSFIGFLERLDTDTEGLYELYLGMLKGVDPRTRKRMGILVSDHQNYLMETRGTRDGAVHNVYKSVKGFFEANELPFKSKNKIIREPIEIPNISMCQINKILNATGSYKIKSGIKFSRDSGLRTGDITNLPIRIVRRALDDPSIEYFTFEWKQGKTRNMANPVLGPDSLEALRVWMNYRENNLGIQAEDGNPLFCTERNVKGFTDKSGRIVREVVKGDWMDEGSMGKAFRYLVKKAGLNPLPGETRLPSIHSLRKYHKTTIEYAGIPTSWVNKMQGRVGEGTGGIYTKPNPKQLIEMYKKCYPALCGIEEGQQEKIDTLTHELGISQYEISELRKERDEYRASYDLRTRLQGIIDKARLERWPEEFIKELEEKLQSKENFEDGVFEYHKLEREIKLEEERIENWDFKVVEEEDEMIFNSSDGWEILKTLNDGRYVMRRLMSLTGIKDSH